MTSTLDFYCVIAVCSSCFNDALQIQLQFPLGATATACGLLLL